MTDIAKSKAEFLLDSVRRGGLHELMQKEIVKIVYGAGYTEDQISHYLSHGRWPSGKRPLKEPSVFEKVDEERKQVSKSIIRRAAFVVLMFIFITFGVFFFLSIIDSTEKNDKPKAAPIETTKDGKRAL